MNRRFRNNFPNTKFLLHRMEKKIITEVNAEQPARASEEISTVWSNSIIVSGKNI